MPDAHWLVDYAHFREMGYDDDQIAEKFGIARDSLDQRFRRLNRKPGQFEMFAIDCHFPLQADVENLADCAVDDAAEITTRLREEDPRELWAELSAMHPTRVLALVYALAAMVPTDRPVAQLLAWTDHLAEAS